MLLRFEKDLLWSGNDFTDRNVAVVANKDKRAINFIVEVRDLILLLVMLPSTCSAVKNLL